ncbi:glycoside hydrolase family 18 protein [Cadophora sp. DSE1049]|nr:glycoside hydrolase family 18 protein [Cadophora sp. DSE1049]
MSSLRLLTTVISLLNSASFSHAIYDQNSKTNLALYWGQGGGQQRLLHFCEQSTVDIIPIGFVHIFPQQGNGFPGSNFANQCWGGTYVYPGPGPNPSLDQLQSSCPQLVADIPICQNVYGKKIILSLGGGTNTYQLTGAANGEAFADFLWGAFGPKSSDWVARGLPRPFDSADKSVEVDGFDFDIEIPSPDNQAGYIAMASRLRQNFQTASKKYILTGAPQCVVVDANMGALISQVQFDIIFVQYYNTPQCSARNWVNANTNFAMDGVERTNGFTYNTWSNFLSGTASANAKIYIGVPGAPDAGGFYLSSDEMSWLIKAHFCKQNFGGVMIWEATSAENNPQGVYYNAVKRILNGNQGDGGLSCRNGRGLEARSTIVPSRTVSATKPVLSMTSSWIVSTTQPSTLLPSSLTTLITQRTNTTNAR